MSHTRRPNPEGHWFLNDRNSGHSLIVMPGCYQLSVEVCINRQGRVYMRFPIEDEETLRRLLNERKKVRDLESENLPQRQQKRITELEQKLSMAQQEIAVLAEKLPKPEPAKETDDEPQP